MPMGTTGPSRVIRKIKKKNWCTVIAVLDFWGCLGSCLFRRLPLYPFWLSQEPPTLLPIYFLHDSKSWFCCLQQKNADWHKYHSEKWTGSSFISPFPSWKTGEQKETQRTESLEHVLLFLLTLAIASLLTLILFKPLLTLFSYVLWLKPQQKWKSLKIIWM